MDDATALRLEKIKGTLAAAHVAAQVQTRRHVAVLAVALTIGGGAAIGGFSGQVSASAATLGAGAAAAAVVAQIRALAVVRKQLWLANDKTMTAIDNLMLEGGEWDDDAKTADARGTRRRDEETR